MKNLQRDAQLALLQCVLARKQAPLNGLHAKMHPQRRILSKVIHDDAVLVCGVAGQRGNKCERAVGRGILRGDMQYWFLAHDVELGQHS